MVEWIEANESILWWMAGLSVAMFIGTLILVPIVIVRLPADYFAHRTRHHTPWADHHPAVRVALRTSKNLLGVVFVTVGLAMLVLPGQGVLTALIGLMMIDFPGKYRFECWLVTRRPVRRTIAWLRTRAGREPLRPPPRASPS